MGAADAGCAPEVRDNTVALAAAIERSGCDVAQARMSELERDMQPLAEKIIAAPATSLDGLRAKALVALWEALPAHAAHQGRSISRTHHGRCSMQSPR